MSPELQEAVEWVKSQTDVPLCEGNYPGVFLLALANHLEGNKARALMWIGACKRPHNSQTDSETRGGARARDFS